ncbi:unnamed protein product [Strongylus vulgaris]|uniref:Uncharacterized protein n=1 Tax=Strongylus vulgaris TaxID=40348 RepID=A0A3P7I610_STRVU|nr:unnamed protein product [Strongylus vulgaris]
MFYFSCANTFLSRCSTIPTQSQLAKSIDESRIKLRKRAKDCENGIQIERLALPVDFTSSQNEDLSAPKGYITVNFNRAGTEKHGEDGNKDGSGQTNASAKFANRSGHDASANKHQDRGSNGDVIGQVSSPVGDENYSKVNFPRVASREGGTKKELTDEGGSLSIAGKPELSFPDDNMVCEIRLLRRKKTHLLGASG